MTVVAERANIREANSRAFREAAAKGAKREIVIIEAGWGSSGYYSEEVLERDIPRIFPVGTHMYLNHPTESEERERPERDLRDLVGVLETSPRMAGIASVAVARIFEHWLPLFEDEEFVKAIGTSIRAFGVAEEGAAGGKQGPIIQTLTEGLSIDYVTQAGAGGAVGSMVESLRERVVPLIETARSDPRQAKVEETLASDIRRALCDAGEEAWADSNTYVYCEDYDQDAGYAVFWIDPKDSADYYYKQGFSLDGDDVTLDGDPEKVDRNISFVPAQEGAAVALGEARNAGNWFEAWIHQRFTERADGLFAEGHLTRDERISLSSAIGAALDAFSSQLGEDAPQLYQRDPYAELDEPEEQYIQEKCGSDGRQNKGDSMTEEERKRLSESEERVRQLERDNADLKEENGTLKTRAERAEERNLNNEASLVAAEAIGSPEGLSPKGIARAVREALSGGVPTLEDGRLDRSTLEERARAKAREELEYLGATDGDTGRVRGIGESRHDSQLPGGSGNGNGEAEESALVEAFEGIGMTEGLAKLAARGR